MAIHRKSHTKSRKGCLQCKTRHTKCSETWPRCANCTRLEIECTWPYRLTPVEDRHYEPVVSPLISRSPSSSYSLPPPRPASSLSSSHAVPSHPTSQPVPSYPTPRPVPSKVLDLAVDDLSLLHHWTLNTALTLTENQCQTYLWQSGLVELGFKHHYLLHGILAVAALHKAVVCPVERPHLLVKSSHHIDAVLRNFTTLIESPDPTTCAPMFTTSCLLSLHKIAEVQVVETNDMISSLCEWFRLIQGVRVVIQPNWLRLKTTEIAPLMCNAKRRGRSTSEVWEVLQLRNLVDQHLAEGDNRRREACLEAIDKLHTTFLEVQDQDSFRDRSVRALVQSWPATVPELYIDLLSQKHPVAMIILAYYAVLIRTYKTWWTKSWDTLVINAVETFLPLEYHEWLNWPKKYQIKWQ